MTPMDKFARWWAAQEPGQAGVSVCVVIMLAASFVAPFVVPT